MKSRRNKLRLVFHQFGRQNHNRGYYYSRNFLQMPSTEFARIMKDLSFFGDACNIEFSKEGVGFSVAGNLGVGTIMIKQNASVRKEVSLPAVVFVCLK